MHRVFFKFLVTALSFSIGGAFATDLQLSLDLPTCKMSPGKPLPAKYYELAKKWKEFRWVRSVQSGDLLADGGGNERADGSRMYDWYTFGKLEMNGDGICDWFLTSLAPLSTGGDSEVLNTLYLGSPSGWSRVGARIPDDKPDGLGWGNAWNEQANFAFSSDAPVSIWDQKNRTTYFIGWYDGRRYGRRFNDRGYRIYRWDKPRNTLQELDKWEPGSPATQVYAFFRQHGAVDTTQSGKDRIVTFDPNFENTEFVLGCLDEKTLAWSVHFARLCKTPALRPSALSLDKSHTPMPQSAQAAREPKKLPPATYEELFTTSPSLKKQDKYLNNAYEYLTAGYDCPAGGVSGCFICGLPLNKIPTFRIEQKRWLIARDKAAKRAGAFGSEPYVAALVKLTTERNSELKKRIEALKPTDPRCNNYLPVE